MKKDTDNSASRDDAAAKERLLKAYKKNILREPLPDELEDMLPQDGAGNSRASSRQDA